MINTAGTITRRTQKASDSLFESLRHMYSKKDLRNALCRVSEGVRKVYEGRETREKAACMSQKIPPSKNAEYGTLHMMLKAAGIAHEDGRELGYYYDLIEASDVPDGEKYYTGILEALFKNYRSYPTPEAFMKRIIDKLACEGNRNESESVRLRILKQFILAGNYLSGWYGGKAVIESYAKEKTGAKKLTPAQAAEALDDSVFEDMERLRTEALEAKEKELGKAPDKSQRRTIEDKYELIKVCEDLAYGRFKTQGGTKKALYLFAMAFDMTYYSGEPDELFDPVSDLEKNLFDDYYTNSFFRFLNGDYRNKDKKAGLDLKFTGEGINYKNFEEMVFIYCIAQDISPAEKIKKASRLIDSLKGSAPGKPAEEKTAFYRELFTGDIIRMSEEDFISFIRENYDCGNKNCNALTLCSARNSAYENYRELLSGLNDELDYYRVISAENTANNSRLSELAAELKNDTAAAASAYFKMLSETAKQSEGFEDMAEQERIVKSIKKAKNDCLKGSLNDHLNNAEQTVISRCDRVIRDMWETKGAYDPAAENELFSVFGEFAADIREKAVDTAVEYGVKLAKRCKVFAGISTMLKTADFMQKKLAPLDKITEKMRAAIKGDLEDSGITRSEGASFIAEDLGLESCNTGLWFFDPAPESIAKLKKAHPSKDWEDYIDLLSAINSFIGYTKEEGEGSERTKPLSHLIEALSCDKDSISRAYMVTAFYYKYILEAERESEDASYMKGVPFESVFEEMKEELDVYLKASYYPEFSGRNIFDVCIALSAYSYITQ